MRSKDPARMSTEEVLAELAELLATGYQRHATKKDKPPTHAANRREDLDAPVGTEAQCGFPRRPKT